MAEVIKMPRMSDTMTEGVIVEWHKKVGDKVKPGDLLAEVETDKATMELESYNEGTILYIGVEKGKSVKVEEVIAVIGKEGEDYKAALSDAAATAPQKEAGPQPEKVPPANGTPKAEAPQKNVPAVTAEQLGVTVIRMPLLSDTMTEGRIVQWNKKVGDKVKSDDNLADVETDKATMEVVGYTDGTLLYVGTPEGEAAKVNDVIAIIGKEGTDVSGLVASLSSPRDAQQATGASGREQVPATAATPQQAAITTPEASEDGRIKASPLAKKVAKDKGVDLKLVQGSGDGGRIIKKDIDNYTPVAAKAATAPAAVAVPAFTAAPGTEGYTDISLNQMRKVIARRLSESKFVAPHFYLTMEIVMDNAMAARTQMNEVSPVKISFNDMVVKAAAMALRRHPAVNSSWMNETIRQWHHIHVGIAVAIEDGLIVPVVRFADQKSLSQIAAESKELSGRARNKKLQPNEFSGNTFTISNLGMMDIDEFTAIINPPDSAIMAVGRIKETVVKKGDGFGVSNIMKITLSCDHRSVDGAVGAAFLQTFKKYLENPVTMLV
ncbi:pyruvate dehydrogenase complex dihydrolipoamide acetyltransferase [Agriterribacter sp.]|uniref:pyruvate dehydrogenase complex dihydrolipoamide acetyltransferase n=1 Tax=Agriterribacter sp. TaxID=2821509 RepID=UPI002B742C3F|nr:pyruvate dehydrogenase complex dihydrolipoamide acetyltransferase [Agriterribacter sp.]HTN05937.1 pyruvate dehydrogenase complex dihydrolipoamide acetyltransferase [Agriterribacter sp.]